ncbi:hypothetical protein N8J89_32405 [Crossiella sp. CA-258035]|uniref:hypothetical protein n=1 Tax=Crossiella sp. CA-258035 TaxID=2981138 RepID=UPI0024BCC560|nr:hypothetical protein [Crossiella sp. CA-258035]WHT17787.1 hypothetical protein N8J89_32405 [Crossiella sp. CA-258035]
MTDLSAAYEALRADAVRWDEAADALEQPRRALDGLHLGPPELSKWAVKAGLDQTYLQARTTMDDMIGKAMETFRLISQTLWQAADTYEREEEASLHTLKNTTK